MKKCFLILLTLGNIIANAQTVTIYRGGSALSTTYSTIAAAFAVAANGDSITLSKHIFYEHDLLLNRYNISLTGVPNGTTIDAGKLGRCLDITRSGIKIKDIIFQNGYSSGEGGCIRGNIEISGVTIQNGYAAGYSIPLVIWTAGGGGVRGTVTMHNNSKIIHNSSGGWGGGVAGDVYAYDSSEISFNSSLGRGGGVWGFVYCRGDGVSITYNKAALSGGGIYGRDSGSAFIGYNVASKSGGGVQGEFSINGARILGNHAPKGAALCTDTFSTLSYVTNSYIYNPDSFGKRQGEMHAMQNSKIRTEGCWWGQGHDVLPLFTQETGASFTVNSYVVPNWRLNRANPIGKNDTLFPLQAALKYNTGAPLVAGSMPWLVGHFSANKGTMTPAIAPINSKDTIQSMFKSFYAPPDSQAVDFLAWVDVDTFKITEIVWGRDTTTKPKDTTADTTTIIAHIPAPQVLVFPNPASAELHIVGANAGSHARLYDIQGRQLLHMIIGNQETIMPIQSLATGTYILRITDPNGNVGVAKVQKE